MLVAHAVWHGGALCLWAERPGPHTPDGSGRHPHATADLTGTSYEPFTAHAPRITLDLLLPTTGGLPLPSPELATVPATVPETGEPELRPWRVPALALDPFAAMALLRHAEEAADVIPGTDLRYLGLVADTACDLVRRGRVLPALVREDGAPAARWRPVPDAGRVRALTEAMPPACRSAGGGRPAGEVLREALGGLADTVVRGTVPHPLLPPRRGKAPDPLPLTERWANALTGPDPWLSREPGDDLDGLAAELDAWAAAAGRPAGPLRTCFRLAEPEPTDAADAWRIEFALQSTEDPSLYVPAATIWAGGAASIADAEETLLAGLGRALRLFPDLSQALSGPAPAELRTGVAGAFRFLRQAAPLLAAAGFGVLLPQWAGRTRLGMRLTTRTQAEAGAVTSSGFGLGSLVDFRWDLAVGDEPLTEEELAELARLKAPLVRLRGRWVELDEAQLEAALDFLRRPRTGTMSAAQAVRAAVHAGDDALPLLEVDADGPLGDLLSGEADHRLSPTTTPEGFNGELRPFQERGLSWLKFLDDLGLGGILADSMGLGKTAQTLALLALERAGGRRVAPTLLVGPMSLVGNWQREAAKFTPKLRVYVHHGGARHRGAELAEAVAQADLVLTTYGTAARDARMLAEIEWGRVVCDEAQALKNSGTRQARAVRGIPARSRLALTGTPVENHLTELWSIMEFVNPGLLGPRSAFRERFAAPIEERGDEAAAAALRRVTGPFVLRRLKTDRSIISDLPDKQEIKVYCNLTAEQASLYQATVDDMLARIAEAADEAGRRGLVLATMARLKQVCNHPAHLLKDGSRLPGRSGKLERLEEICAEILGQGEKALAFTQYAEFGSMLQPYLAARLGRPVLWLHGGTPKARRDELVQRFQEDAEPAVFLLSLKAAGTGLTLTAANHVVHIDRWWNPAVEDQATDRAFRIGQTRNVQVRKFICVGTLEERVDEMIERKKALAESVVGTGEDWLTELSVAELRDVLRLSPEAVSD
ncbi:Superfamily II DNA or RNA helicase, SNF2 family [Thermomonospora echinospora]|uniref:Superfamily II DNA or RNA helicase, SNF2 family n=1 Tax=Thermomonospora echinospora TaxID=1992 RepID=A0A1H5UX51_9ACTN|nr:DEAD/DEAH box helicase [Thermomonospora echinospora]SEF79616.1 Superfamily II DNA or RNA helicase, SNF2 family [Thermomonospora echinospora]